MGSVNGWDFADGAWLGAPSGLIRKDNSIKPSYVELNNMIHKEWHTKLTAKTDEAGCIKVKGYRGEYVVSEVGTGKKGSFKLAKDSDGIVTKVQ